MNNICRVIVSGDCTGCGCCINVCPAHCIEIKRDNEGFDIPTVNLEECIDCGSCLKKCHTKTHTLFAPEETFVGFCLDSELSKLSSSGGIFPIMARSILRRGGVVYGAAFDSDFSLHHIGIHSESVLDRIQGSKYVQSDIVNVYSDIAANIEDGLNVMFVGTPCQVASLRNYFGEKLNLILIDLICHGVPSPGFWEKYYDFAFKSRDIISISFRLKNSFNRSAYAMTLRKHEGAEYIQSNRDFFYSAFLESESLRECCYKCPYASTHRPGDITLGDCASSDCYLGLSSTKQLSTILLNTEKGKSLFQTICDELRFEDLDYERESRLNMQLRNPASRPTSRDGFYDGLSVHENSLFHKRINTFQGSLHSSRLVQIVKDHIPVIFKGFMKKVVYFVKKS